MIVAVLLCSTVNDCQSPLNPCPSVDGSGYGLREVDILEGSILV
jgi:hypothetical protein